MKNIFPHDGDHIARDPINPDLAKLLNASGLGAVPSAGHGSKLQYDVQGTVLDMIPGFGAAPLGHGQTAVTAAVSQALSQDEPNLVAPVFSDQTTALAERLTDLAPMNVDRVHFASTGSESVEIALNSARLATDRLRFIAAVNGCHGQSVGGLSVTHTEEDNQFAALAGTIFVPFGDLTAMEEVMKEDADSIAAVILEPVQGYGGVKMASQAYFQAVRALCDTYGVILIFDEIMTGVGRTGHLFASEWLGVSPDILLLGKALGGGVMPISACLFNERAATDSIFFQHLSSHVGNRLAATAAHAMLDHLEENDGAVLGHISAMGARLDTVHKTLHQRFPHMIKETRGKGLLHAIEFTHSDVVRSGGHGALLELANAMKQIPELITGNLLSRGARVSPALNAENVLMIAPSYDIQPSDIDTYETLLTNCLTSIDQRRTPDVISHLSGVTEYVDVPLMQGERLDVEPVGEIGPDEGRFAFILHWLEANDIQMLDPTLRALPRSAREKLARQLGEIGKPSVLSRVRIRGEDGSTAVGDFIAIPCSARQLMDMDPEESAQRVQEAVNLGVERGARIVGLGGYTSIVTRAGMTIDPLGAALTTGNGFTIEAALMAAEYGCSTLGRDQSKVTAAIVGAAGSIGSGLVQILVGRVARLYLIVNPTSPRVKSVNRLKRSLVVALKAYKAKELVAKEGTILHRAGEKFDDFESIEALASALLDDPDFFVISDDCKASLKHAEIVYSATNSTDKLISPEDLRPKSMVCDLSRPGNISYRCREEREDVLLFDGGVMAFPGGPELGLGYDMPKGVSFACVAETAILALKKHYKNTSVGASPSHSEIAMLREFASDTGFKLADLRAFDRPLGRVEWAHLLSETAASVPEAQLAKMSLSENEGSIAQEDDVDFYATLVGNRAQSADQNQVAIEEVDGTKYTWSEFDQAARAMAQILADKGVTEGKYVVVAGEGGFRQIASIAALWLLGATPVALDSDLPKKRITGALALVDPMLTVGTDAVLNKYDDSSDVFALPTVSDLLSAPIFAGASKTRAASTNAIVVYTSGSTGVPKAVGHTYADFVNMAANYGATCVEFSPQDRVIVTSKLCYSFGFSVSFVALLCGSTLLLGNGKFHPENLLKQIHAQQPTVLYSFPTVFNILLKHPISLLKSLRLCIAAGEAKSHFIDDRWEKVTGVPIHNGFGTTEAMSFVFATPKSEAGGRNLGVLVPGFDVEIRRQSGEIAKIGEAGVAWIRGNTLANQYIGAPQKTAEAFQDGFYCTKDIMRMDEAGRFHYLGRDSDIVKVGGIWMSPNDTQNLIAAHTKVRECAVVLHENPAPLVRPYAFVVPAKGVETGPELAQQLRETVAAEMSKAQVPYKVFFIDFLPKTGNGKVQRNTLSEMVESQLIASQLVEG